MRIGFNCPAEMESLLPRPKSARHGLPQWIARTARLGGGHRRGDWAVTPPALATGFLLPLAADVEVVGGRFQWSWPLGAATAAPYACSPVTFESCEYAGEAPLCEEAGIIIRFNNFWSIDLDPGWSLLVIHPVNREELPFRTLYGVIEAEVPRSALARLPAMWIDPEFEGILPRGTPIAQCIPIQRTALDLVFGTHRDGLHPTAETSDTSADPTVAARER